MLKSEIKKHAAVFGTFFGIIFGVFAILITMILLSRNSWKTTLASEMQTVLDSYGETHYTVNKFIDIDSTLSTSSAVYSLIKKGASSNEQYYGVMIRISSIIGPVPAVFIYNENKKVNFAGYAADSGKAADLLNIREASGNMNYWESMIPLIIEKSKARQGSEK